MSPMMRLMLYNKARRAGASRRWWLDGVKRAAADLAWSAVELSLCFASALMIAFAIWLFVGGR